MADEPRYMGGQAVLEGVMMRGTTTYAIAVREPDGWHQSRRAPRSRLVGTVAQHSDRAGRDGPR